MGFRFLPKLMILNDPEDRMAVVLRYFTEFVSFGGQLRQSRCTDGPILSATKM